MKKEQKILISKFDGGLWLVGGREHVPQGMLRRATGMSHVRTVTALSRFGSQIIYGNEGATSITEYGDTQATHRLVYGTNNGALFNGGVQVLPAGTFNTNRLSFTKGPPQLTFSATDYLFISNGGALFKMDTNGNVTNWGIAAPNTDLTATLAPIPQYAFEELLNDHTNWTAVQGSATLSDDTFSPFYGGALKCAIATNIFNVTLQKAQALNLNFFATAAWAATTSYTASATYPWTGSRIKDSNGNVQVATTSGTSQSGVHPVWNTVPGQTTHDGTVVWTNYGPAASTTSDTISFWWATSSPSDTFAIGIAFVDGNGGVAYYKSGTYTQPAYTFAQVTVAKGNMVNGTGIDWANITDVQFTIQVSTNGANIWFSNIEMIGGVGMSGTYQYAVVFANTVTGSVSNPQPIGTNNQYVTVTGDNRQAIVLTNIPISTDAQVNARIIYRTEGNNAILLYDQIINDNTTTEIVDTVADFYGANGGNEPAVLGVSGIYPSVLQTDNSPPSADFGVVAGPFLGCWFWTNPSDPSKVYYSPVGRPESVENFLVVSTNDDPILTLFIFNQQLYALGSAYCYPIQQVSESPLIFTAPGQILGVPGVVDQYSVAVGKNGVAWRAAEGFVLFNGFMTQQMDLPINNVVQGATVEGYALGTVTQAMYAKGEFWFTDGINDTYCFHEDTGTWRTMGIPFNALAFDGFVDQPVGESNTAILYIEQFGYYQDGAVNVPFQFQPPAAILGEDVECTVTRMVFDINTNQGTASPLLIIDDSDLRPSRAGSTLYTQGNTVIDGNGNIVQATVTGTTGASAPRWSTTIGGLTTDGSQVWQLKGPGSVALANIITLGRQRIEYDLKVPAHTLTVQLSGTLANQYIEWFELLIVYESGV